MKHYYQRYLYLAFFLSFIISPFFAQAQTPGLIYKPAANGGEKILDPNGDGYVSVQRTPPGFAGTRDEGAGFSEITYRPFPALENEPLNDITTGSNGGHTDLAPPNYTGATGSPISAFYNGTQVMFRIRLGGASTASKGYSVMIDTDGLFGNLVEGSNPATTPNPGFEFEVVFASNFEVSIYDHRGKPTGGSKIWSGSVDQYSQRAVAASTSSGNADYFYDFYVPLSAFPSSGTGSLTADTPLRFSGITITSAQSGISGTVSDVGGVNYAAYDFSKQKAWGDVISTFPATSLNQLRSGEFGKLSAKAPVVNPNIIAGATSISGTSSEALNATITVFRKVGTAAPVSIGTTTVTSDGLWTLTGIPLTLLQDGDIITATVTPTSKNVSPASAPVTVKSGVCTGTTPPRLTGISTGAGTRFFDLIPSYSGFQILKFYYTENGVSKFISSAAVNLTAGTAYTSAIAAPVNNTNYTVTSTPTTSTGTATGCESLNSNRLCYTTNNSSTVNPNTVTINSVSYNGTTNNAVASPSVTEVPLNLSAINVTLALNGGNQAGNLVVYKNGLATSFTTPYTTSTTTATINTSGISLVAGDVLAVRTVQTAGCAGQSVPSNFLTVQETTATPTINPITACGKVITLTGTSTEPAGTVLQFYTGGTAGQRNGTLILQSGTSTPITATVTNQGNWAVNFSGAASGGIAAGTAITTRAKAVGKIRSVNSNAVSSTLAPVAPVVNTPITEGATTVSGTAPAGSQVTLAIDGTPFTPVTATGSGTWTVSGLSALEVFAGASVTATYKISGNECVSERSTPVIVNCTPPATSPTVTPGATALCSGSNFSVTLSNSEYGVTYRLVTQTGTSPNFVYTESGASALGNGGTITLTSAAVTGATTFRVRARKVSGAACDAIFTGTYNVTANPLPPSNYVLTINSSSAASGCAGTSPVISLAASQTGFSYQLINDSTKQPVLLLGGNSDAKDGTGGTLTFTVASVSATTTYGIRVVNTAQTTKCAVENTNKVTYTVNGPSSNQSVTISTNRTCAGGSAIVYVATNNDTFSYQLYRASDNTTVGAAFTGNGQVQQITVSPTVTTTYYVRVVGNTCTVDLTNRVTLEVNAGGPVVSAGQNQTVCGSTATLQGSNPAPGTGKWTINTTSGNNTNATFTNSNSATTEVTGLTSGTYTFTWTVTTANCGSSSANTTVIVNCPAQYSVAPPRYKSQYRVNDILATASDPDKLPSAPETSNGVSSASLASGSLPPGTELLGSGNIRVSNPSALFPGTYRFSVSTFDQRSVETITPMAITIYGEEPTITPLPVELVYFTATVQNGIVNLQWLTASEENNKAFEVERSADGKTFEHIGTVKGNGNSSQPIRYSYADKNPLDGTVYYRLKQLDFDGEFAYSKVIAVSALGIAADMQLQVYPNPFANDLNITITAHKNGNASLQLLDMQGKTIHTGNVELHPGLNELTLPLRFVKKGLYILKLSGNGINGTVKVLKN